MNHRARAPRAATAMLTIALAVAAPSSASADTSAATTAPGVTAGADRAPVRTSTVRFTAGRTYVVTARLGSRVLRGKGRLPHRPDRGAVRALPARDALGSRSVEVLLDLGPVVEEPTVRLHTLHTARRGRLRSVRLGGRQVLLASYSEGGDDGGFRCRRGRLLTHWYHRDSGQGEQTAYRLAGTRLRPLSTRPLRRPVASRPESCA